MSEDWTQDLPDASGFEEWDDLSDVDMSKVGLARVNVEEPGWYHFKIEATEKPQTHAPDDMSKQRSPHIQCLCKVLQTVEGQSPADAIYFHQVDLGGKGGGPPEPYQKTRTLNFLLGVGILKKVNDLILDPDTGTAKLNVKTLCKRLNGLQFIGNLQKNTGDDPKYAGRIEFRFGQGAFPIDAKEVAHVPKNVESLKAAGLTHVSPGRDSVKTTTPPTSGSAKKTTATAPASTATQLVQTETLDDL